MTSSDFIAAEGKGFETIASPEEVKAALHVQYGENKKITDGAYHASPCITGVVRLHDSGWSR